MFRIKYFIQLSSLCLMALGGMPCCTNFPEKAPPVDKVPNSNDKGEEPFRKRIECQDVSCGIVLLYAKGDSLVESFSKSKNGKYTEYSYSFINRNAEKAIHISYSLKNDSLYLVPVQNSWDYISHFYITNFDTGSFEI